MQHVDRKSWSLQRLATISACVIGLLGAGKTAQAADVIVPGNTDFPESMTGTADGTLFFSSFAGGRVFRSAPGATEAKEWIKQGANGLSSVLGVLADPKSNTLYACSDDVRWGGITVPGGDEVTALKLFDLTTGEPKSQSAAPCLETVRANGAVQRHRRRLRRDGLRHGFAVRLHPAPEAGEQHA